MTSNDAQSQDRSQKPVIKRPVGRIVPAIPRQLTRPRRQQFPVKETVIEEVEKKAVSPKPETGRDADNGVGVNGHAAENIKFATDKLAAPVGQVETTTSQTKPEQASEEATAHETKQEKSEEQSNQVKEVKEMREVKDVKDAKEVKQLPPPFYPSRETHMSLSTSSLASLPPASSPIVLPTTSFSMAHHHPPHLAHLSAESIVFGGQRDSSSASPVPPAPGSGVFVQQSAPPFVNGANVLPHQVPHSSADVYSYDSHYQTHPHFPPHPANQDWMPPPNYQPSLSFARPPINGMARMSRTPSQTSSGIDASATRNTASGIMTPDPFQQSHIADGAAARSIPSFPLQSHAPTPSIQQPPANSAMNNMQDLRRFLLDRFGTYDFADHVLDLATGQTIPVHSILLARSPAMQTMMRDARKDDSSHHVRLNIPAHYYFRNADAFIEAVRYLYGGEPLDAARFLQGLPPPQPTSLEIQTELSARITYALSYVASGLTLDIEDIHFKGVQIAERLLCWETLEPVFDFILATHHRHGVAVRYLLHSAIEFISMNFPFDFTCDTTAPQLASMPRLPAQQQTEQELASFPDSRRPSHHRFKSIRFGDAPASPDTSLAASVLSSLLLSLPFDILQEVFNSYTLRDRLGRIVIAQYMHAIVAEREKRRQNTLGIYLQSGRLAKNNAALQNLYWEEAVSPSDHTDVPILIHRRVESPGGPANF